MDKRGYTGYSKKEMVVKSKSILTIDYLDTKPNYFRIQNAGLTTIYVGTDSIPTATKCDFKVDGGKMRAYGEPFQRARIYIYNPGNNDINISVVSFAAPFDPLILALSELEVEVASTLSANVTVVDALPAGSNNIGEVDINSTDLEAIKENLENLLLNDAAENQFNLRDLFYVTKGIRQSANNQDVITLSSDSTSSVVAYTAATGYYIDKLIFVSNDGDSDKILRWREREHTSTQHSLTIKAGEVVSEMPVNASEIWYESGGGRIVYTIRPVL